MRRQVTGDSGKRCFREVWEGFGGEPEFRSQSWGDIILGLAYLSSKGGKWIGQDAKCSQYC